MQLKPTGMAAGRNLQRHIERSRPKEKKRDKQVLHTFRSLDFKISKKQTIETLSRWMNTHHSNTAPTLKSGTYWEGKKEKLNLNNEANEMRQHPRETHTDQWRDCFNVLGDGGVWRNPIRALSFPVRGFFNNADLVSSGQINWPQVPPLMSHNKPFILKPSQSILQMATIVQRAAVYRTPGKKTHG